MDACSLETLTSVSGAPWLRCLTARRPISGQEERAWLESRRAASRPSRKADALTTASFLPCPPLTVRPGAGGELTEEGRGPRPGAPGSASRGDLLAWQFIVMSRGVCSLSP